jgi:hypothetical protein
MPYTFVVLTPTQVQDQWTCIRELISPAIPFCHGDYEADDFLPMIHERKAFAVGVKEDDKLVLVCIAQVVVLPRQKVMYILVLGGRALDHALKLFRSELGSLAQVLEVSAIRGMARPAMQRFYRRFAPDSSQIGAVMELRL